MPQCLMLETKDQRKFFTHKKNYPLLIEFSKTFDADISVVKIKSTNEILDISNLVPAICDATFKQKIDYEVLEKKISHKSRKRKSDTRSTATKIKEYIEDQFLKGKVVELHKIAEKFKKHELSLACFCNHIAQVRYSLQKKGHTFVKIGGGKYKLDIP